MIRFLFLCEGRPGPLLCLPSLCCLDLRRLWRLDQGIAAVCAAAGRQIRDGRLVLATHPDPRTSKLGGPCA